MKCDKMISFVLSLMSLVAFTNSEEYQVSWQYDFLNMVVLKNSRIVQDGAVFTLTNQVNDAITWNFKNSHNLVEVDTLEEWLDCDSTFGNTRGPLGTKVMTTVFTEVNKRYFICTVGGPGGSHCDTGQQKLVVNTVVSPSDPETLVPTPPFRPETTAPTPRFPNVNKCTSLTKKACKKNAKKSGECSYVDVYSCFPKDRKNKSNKRKCKKFNNGDKSLKKKDKCEDKEKKGEKICKVKKVSSLGYCRISD